MRGKCLNPPVQPEFPSCGRCMFPVQHCTGEGLMQSFAGWILEMPLSIPRGESVHQGQGVHMPG